MRGRRDSDLVLSLQFARLAVALQLASLAQQVVKGGHRAGQSVEGFAPSLFPPPADVSARTLPTSEGAKGRAAQRSQGFLRIVEPQRRVAALPRRALIGRRCGRRSMRFGAASGPTLGPTTVTFLRVTTQHSAGERTGGGLPQPPRRGAPPACGICGDRPGRRPQGDAGRKATRNPLALGVRQRRRHRRASRRARGRHILCGACPGRRAPGLHRGRQCPLWPDPGSTPSSGRLAVADGAAEGVEESERSEEGDGGGRSAGAGGLLPADLSSSRSNSTASPFWPSCPCSWVT
jgi:hypothetical protein